MNIFLSVTTPLGYLHIFKSLKIFFNRGQMQAKKVKFSWMDFFDFLSLKEQPNPFKNPKRANFLLVTSYQYQSLVTSYQSLVTSHQLLVTSYQPLVTSYQLIVTSYQSLVTSHQLLVTSHQLLVTSYQSLVTSYQLLALITSYQSLVTSYQH